MYVSVFSVKVVVEYVDLVVSHGGDYIAFNVTKRYRLSASREGAFYAAETEDPIALPCNCL